MLLSFLNKLGIVVSQRASLFGLTFVVLCLLAVLCGGLLGVILGYTIDLPQIQELEDVRPNVVSYVYSSD